MNKTLLSLLAAALLAASPIHAQDIVPLERIAAVVDEDVILQSELDRAVANVLAQYAGRSDQLPPREILERQVLERLVLVRLQTARAGQMGVRVSDAEVDGAVGMIAQQNGFTPDQLRQQLAADGLSFDEFRSSLREELMVQRLRQRFAQTRIVVSDAEVDAALAGDAVNRQYQLAHILVALPDGATPEQITTAEEKIEGIKALVERGEMAFQAAAVRYSDSPNALEGGSLGWRSLDEIPTAFSGAVQSMQPGEVLGPMRGPSGFQLLQLVEVRDAQNAGSVTQYQARHILIRSGGDVSDEQARARAQTLRARAAGGADFAELARENTDDPSSRERGGDLGWFTIDQFGPDFGAQVAGIEDGAISEPFKTQAGWHIVQRVGTRQAAADNDNRRAQVREAIGQRKLEDEWNRFLREIRGEAYVDVRSAAAPAGTGG
ncbi:molecular chaperone SurA [Luteimonas yindakuii]|uniref:Chaperone SurA n=1 Tax=Luteimonas yindakuii TaxID=2565782 RepID=A0A4Z1R511_9GAMM|nr:peptidylprolyl isomerase [Luteimonas yindakuii]QCO68278.1 molecular chaperone SurA [Luteimonas yindakuii]TKS54672.1 molecular chaperone SurA [Luteimonas yindakuii]